MPSRLGNLAGKFLSYPFLLVSICHYGDIQNLDKALKANSFRKWRAKGVLKVWHLIQTQDKRYLSFPELQSQYHLSPSQYLHSCQLFSFLKSRPHDITNEISLNIFDIRLGSLAERHTLTMLYQKSRKGNNTPIANEPFSRWSLMMRTFLKKS